MAEYIVIGLGTFGRALAIEIQAMGNEVIGIDVNRDIVQEMSGQIREAIEADATSEATMSQLGVRDVDAAVVAVGSTEDSILITLILKKIGVSYVISKAENDLHGEILRLVGADRVVYPEKETAIRLAHGIAVPEIVDYLSITYDTGVAKLEVPVHLVGKSYAEVEADVRADVRLLAIVRRERIIYGASVGEPLQAGDVLLLSGKDPALRQFSLSTKKNGR